MEKLDITLAQIRRKDNLDDSRFLELYKKLLFHSERLDQSEKYALLKFAVYFLNSKDLNVERFGYRIILHYSNTFNDYLPLYDIALNKDYIPVSRFIERKFIEDSNTDSFSRLFRTAYQEGFKIEGDNADIYRSLGQMQISAFSSFVDNLAIIAPTSYGKSDMIVKKVRNALGQKICVIVPSKALLAQTKRSLLKEDSIRQSVRKIVTHPDMYRQTDTDFVAVLTQERLLRLLQKNKELAFDLVLVDEAHNILEDSERALLLAQVLLINQNRNEEFKVNFFSPFIADITNLNILNFRGEIRESTVKEQMKVEVFYGYDFDSNEKFLYDQFLNRAFPVETRNYSSYFRFIEDHKGARNIIYFNRPKDVETFALEMTSQRQLIPINDVMQKIIKSIGDFVHPDYHLITCIRRGVIYHHGGIPDIVRLYIEDVYTKNGLFDYIVTTSTLLEGVNIPAEKIFILSPNKGRGHLNSAQFKNLIGRVCRFREIFDLERGSLKMLEPEIYLLKGQYSPSNLALLEFFKKRVNSSILIEDKVENPLLENSQNESTTDALEFLENLEEGSSGLLSFDSPTSDIGRLCFINNVRDFNILENELHLIENLGAYHEMEFSPIDDSESLINAIVMLFFDNIELREKDGSLNRLKEHVEARRFYSMFLGWRSQGAPYRLMIARFLNYWTTREQSGDPFIHVGSKWGEESRGEGHKTLYVNIARKNEVERINLAIAKIKDEQEFVDFHIVKYLEVINELDLMDSTFYDQVKYGTTDRELICMLKNGMSIELARLLLDHYRNFLQFNIDDDIVKLADGIVERMEEDERNDILIFEVGGHL